MGKRGLKPGFVDVACPNDGCGDYGKVGEGNVVGNGTYQNKSGTVHKYICRTCSVSFSSRSKTIFYDLKTDEKIVIQALKMILKGMSIRGTADVLEVKPDTVRGWLQRAAEHSEEVNKALMKNIKVNKVELDELWTFVQKKQFRKWSMSRKTKDGSG